MWTYAAAMALCLLLGSGDLGRLVFTPVRG
jgi:hypothetical protein